MSKFIFFSDVQNTRWSDKNFLPSHQHPPNSFRARTWTIWISFDPLPFPHIEPQHPTALTQLKPCAWPSPKEPGLQIFQDHLCNPFLFCRLGSTESTTPSLAKLKYESNFFRKSLRRRKKNWLVTLFEHKFNYQCVSIHWYPSPTQW